MNQDTLFLGPLEQKIMELVWKSKGITCRELVDRLNTNSKKNIAYTTLMTVTDRLYKKGLLDREKRGKTFIYNYKETRNETLRGFAESVLKSLVGRFGEDAIVAFSKEIKEFSDKDKNE